MFSLQIREILPEKFPDIIDIIDETWEPTYRPILSQEQIAFMQQEIYNPVALQHQYDAGQRFYGLYENDNPVGFAAFSLLESGTYKLNKIYVKPGGQGKGYGQLLLGHIEQEIVKAKGHTLRLNVNRYNTARAFYERLGFSVIKEENVPIGPYLMNDFVMQKQLA